MISDPSSDLYAYARACGGHFVSPSMANRVDDWAAAIEDAKTAAKVAADQGMQFTYHNHAQEFQRIDGQYALDMLYERTDPAAVQAELDVYWIRKGGADPVAYIRKYVGRVPQVHLKDMDPSDESFAEIGAGCLDIKGICEAAAEARTDWIIVEQDTCKQPSIDAARQSVEFLKQAGLA
jgi:sugar phosphate isomerase/epimerase